MHRSVRTGLRLRPAAAVALALAGLLAACSGGPAGRAPAASDLAAVPRGEVRDGGTLHWAVDAVPSTLNTFQADATPQTSQIAAAALPALFTVDGRGRPRRNPDFLVSAKVLEQAGHQEVVYRINPKAVWSDGRPVTADDFAAQWRALCGKDSGFWAAHNDGYDRVAAVRRGTSDQEVRVTFARPFAAWRSLFTPLYPQSVTGGHDAFNDGARGRLPVGAGPFTVQDVDARGGTVTLVRNRAWWGERPKLDRLELTAVPADRRAAALADGSIDIAPIEPAALPAVRRMRGVTVHRALGASFTQLTLNGASGPLADERVRRAVVRAIDRKAIADLVLRPAGLPARPLGNHLMLASQDGYRDNSSAVGGRDLKAAQALLGVAGWRPVRQADAAGHPARAPRGPAGEGTGRPAREAGGHREGSRSAGRAAATSAAPAGRSAAPRASADPSAHPSAAPRASADPSAHPSAAPRASADPSAGLPRAHRAPGDAAGHRTPGGKGGTEHAARGSRPRTDAGGPADAPERGADTEAAAADTVVEPAAVRADGSGRPLSLRFVVPAHRPTLGAVADRVAHMLAGAGIRTDIERVSDDGFFRDHIATGDFDLALYSWPGSPYPAEDARPVYAKPQPAADGSLTVLENYSRVGTDRIDQLFRQASRELDPARSRALLQDADSRIWAAAASVPLYQRPELVATRASVANAGAFGFASPRYQDIGFRT